MNNRQWQTAFNTLRTDQRVPLILIGVLGILLLCALWQLIDTLTIQSDQLTSKKMIHHTKPYHLDQFHLFGVYNPSLDALPNAITQLTLQGTIVSVGNPALSRAVIAAPGQPGKVYRVGDVLPGNATITVIMQNYIVISDNGASAKLALPIPTLPSNNP